MPLTEACQVDYYSFVCMSRYDTIIVVNSAQKTILELARTRDVGKLTLREIGLIIGVSHPQTVKYHLDTLIKRGLLHKNNTGSIRVVDPNQETNGLIQVPILGSANCGQALVYADSDIKGFLPVSPNILNQRSYDDLFCVIASGSSMNAADINGKNIVDGDYVIAKKLNPFEYKQGDYVVVSFEGMANIKKFTKNEEQGYIALQSESWDQLPPIYITGEDVERLQVHGKVIKVLGTH